MNNTIKYIWIPGSLLVAIIVVVIVATYSAEKQQYRGVAMEDLTELFQPEVKALGVVVIKNYREYRGNAVRWSAVYFGCLFGSAFLSAMAALFLKLEVLSEKQKLRNDLAAVIDSKAPYMALVRHGVFDSMLTRQDGERLILKALMEQSRIQNQM